MQPVDVLRQHAVELAGALQPRQRGMRGVGLCVGIEHHVFIERPKLIRAGEKVADVQHILVAFPLRAAVEPVRAAKIRDAAFRAHPGPAEKHRAFALF